MTDWHIRTLRRFARRAREDLAEGSGRQPVAATGSGQEIRDLERRSARAEAQLAAAQARRREAR